LSPWQALKVEEILNLIADVGTRVQVENGFVSAKSKATAKAGMLQPRLSVLEDSSYSSWSISTLRRLARAFDLTLKVSFESFASFIFDFESLGRETLERTSFKDDPLFQAARVSTSARFRKKSPSHMDLAMRGQLSLFKAQVIPFPHAASQGESQRKTTSSSLPEAQQKREELANAAVVGGNG
jgi:hypothetical protein